MAVMAGIYGETQPSYIGCVINTYERNGYDDSDFYAVCWDEAAQAVVEIEYDTTRCGSSGYAEIDASTEVLRKAFRYYYNCARAEFDKKWNAIQAKQVKVGDTLNVVRGRKIKPGSQGTCFWIGTRRNFYTYRDETRVGIEIDGEKHFLPIEYVEVIGWEARLIKGKERHRRIRAEAVRNFPYSYR